MFFFSFFLSYRHRHHRKLICLIDVDVTRLGKNRAFLLQLLLASAAHENYGTTVLLLLFFPLLYRFFFFGHNPSHKLNPFPFRSVTRYELRDVL